MVFCRARGLKEKSHSATGCATTRYETPTGKGTTSIPDTIVAPNRYNSRASHLKC